MGSLSNYYLQRCRREGSDFNLLVIGPAGCGKATLLSTVYQQEVLPRERRRHARTIDGLEFVEYASEIEEAGVVLRLQVTEVLGYGELSFGGNAQHAEKIAKIVKHVEGRHLSHFERENCAHRPSQKRNASTSRDQLYHAAIVFVQPQRGLALSANDCALLQALQPRVNLIPVVAKADTFVPEELSRVKGNLKAALTEAKVLQFPNITDVSDDDWVIKEAVEVRAHCPFTTVAASPANDHNGVRYREYPWGLVPVESTMHRGISRSPSAVLSSISLGPTLQIQAVAEGSSNDLLPLQKMLIRSHFEFLKRHTAGKLYENYRTEMVCQVQLAPEAPMRMSKSAAASREEIRAKVEKIQQKIVQQSQSQGKLEPVELAPVAPQSEDEAVFDEDTFVAASLDPIREEDGEEPVNHGSLAASLERLAPQPHDAASRKKKVTVKRLKPASGDRLEEAKDIAESPRPIAQ